VTPKASTEVPTASSGWEIPSHISVCLSFPSPSRKKAGGLGERYSSPSGSGRSPAAKRILVQFTAQNLQICNIFITFFSGVQILSVK